MKPTSKSIGEIIEPSNAAKQDGPPSGVGDSSEVTLLPNRTGFSGDAAFVRFLTGIVVVTLLLGVPWTSVFRGALADKLYSYVLLIPIISGWLLWQGRPGSLKGLGSNPVLGGLLLGLASGVTLAGIYGRKSGIITTETSWLTTQMATWVLAIWGFAFLFLGRSWIRANLFPVAFLIFTIPIPEPCVDFIEHGLQAASATASDFLFRFAGTPYIRDEMTFWFPGIHITVAPECSGIRSTLVLFITGILGSYLLLRRTLHRVAIVSTIIPLGIFRNAIRILTLTLLSVHVNPQIMHSALHKRGGPLFFAVSLIPLFLLFWWFARRERSSVRTPVRDSKEI